MDIPENNVISQFKFLFWQNFTCKKTADPVCHWGGRYSFIIIQNGSTSGGFLRGRYVYGKSRGSVQGGAQQKPKSSKAYS
jgi:hypothetical protein